MPEVQFREFWSRKLPEKKKEGKIFWGNERVTSGFWNLLRYQTTRVRLGEGS